jgi:hypothetical protein
VSSAVSSGATVSPSPAIATAFVPYPTLSATHRIAAELAAATGQVLTPTVGAVAVASIAAEPARASAVVAMPDIAGITETFQLPHLIARGIAAYDV